MVMFEDKIALSFEGKPESQVTNVQPRSTHKENIEVKANAVYVVEIRASLPENS
jgi:hypothetical protein